MTARSRGSFFGSLTLGLTLFAVACGGGGGTTAPESESTAPAAARADVPMDKSAYPVFPDADAGADPAVPAEQGGKGFTGEGWQTNASYELVGDPRAVKGGTFREFVLDFPGTLRVEGPESNTALNYMIGPMVYESLLTVHPTTLDYIPVLATHWQVSDDKLTYRYRINPNARWADGRPIVADDVVASWMFKMDKGLQDPSNEMTFGKFEKPVAESKYIVSVKSKQLNWRNFLYFSGMSILPAHILKDVPGERYLKDYNFRMIPGSGPYVVEEADVVKGKSVTIRRRKTGYWAENHRRNVGVNNFDEIREIVVRDQKLAFEMFKKGDLDTYFVNISREWVEEMNFDKVQRGLIQKVKVFNDAPAGFSGLAFNTRRAPFDDVRVRMALAHLMNRPLLIEKIFFNEYVPLDSYHAGGIYENPANPKMAYDPKKALELLGQAGFSSRDAQGRLVRGGVPLTVEIIYASKTSEPFLTIYQEDLRKAGITVNLRLITGETLFKLVMDREYSVANMAWGALLFPNPETSFHSRLADVKSNNNITGMKNPTIDALLAKYDVEFDPAKRVALIREVDGLLAAEHHYALGWEAPFSRIAFWNRFGFPQGVLTRIGDSRDIPTLWWHDPGKQQALAQAMGSSSATLPVGPVEVRHWLEYGKQHPMGANTN
ncbi:MAG: extracellular solute-binding protein [Vicinamibacterales bacterium]